MPATSLLDALATLESLESAATNARKNAKDSKVAVDDAFSELVVFAAKSETEEVAEHAKGVLYCDEEIDKLVAGSDGNEENDIPATDSLKAMRSKVKVMAADLRAAARSGGPDETDAAAAARMKLMREQEMNLAEAEDELGLRAGTLSDLKKMRKEHAKKLRSVTSSTF